MRHFYDRLKKITGVAVLSRLVAFVLIFAFPVIAAAKEGSSKSSRPPSDVLSPADWQKVDRSVERALAWLAEQQQPDGSFPSLETGQPGVTCLCILAFMANGHLPGEGVYGKRLERATQFALDCQKQNGLVALVAPDGPQVSRAVSHEIGVTAAYNHAISSLVISEIYGMSGPDPADRIEGSISKALDITLAMQRWPKDRPEDRGGWRYIDAYDRWDSDVSVTGWQLMFLRSARNAGFNVPKKAADDAIEFIRRAYSPEHGAFSYVANPTGDARSRGMAGAGILALALAGRHQSTEAKQSGEWLLVHHFDAYNESEIFSQSRWIHDRYHYAAFNACMGMYQLGGRYWDEFYPRLVPTLLANQAADGSWPAENHKNDARFGNAYTTALVVLTLGAPNQLIPVFQR